MKEPTQGQPEPAPGVVSSDLFGGWRTIETAPKTGEPILLWGQYCQVPAGGRWEQSKRREGWRCDGDQCIPRNQQDCTHWMPLPLPHRVGLKRLPAQAPLRTVRESFLSHGSSLSMDTSRCGVPRLGKHVAQRFAPDSTFAILINGRLARQSLCRV